MEGFAWAENNLGVDTPHELQARGVNVFFAPDIDRNVLVINLANGRIDTFHSAEERPRAGYYVGYNDLAGYCRGRGLPLNETNGQASIQPVGFDEAGNPLLHGDANG